MTAGNRWAGPPLQKQAFVSVSRPSSLRSASAGLATSLLHSIVGNCTHPPLTRVKAEPTCPGHVGRCGGWLRRTLTFGADGLLTGGRRFLIACRSAANNWTAFQTQHPRLCALCVLCGSLRWVTGSGSICLICGQFSLCPLCLCGSDFQKFPGVETVS